MEQYNYFPGCTLKTTGIELEKSALYVCEKIGIKLVELPRWHCCGTVVSLQMDNKMHSLGAIRTMIRAQETGKNELVTICSICYNTLLRVNKMFNTNAEFRDAVVKFMDDEKAQYEGNVRIIHLLELLKDKIDSIKSAIVHPLTGLKVSAYYGCLLLRPHEFSIDENPEAPTILDDLIRTLGAIPVENPYKIECCGSYETVDKPDQVADMVYRIISGARKNGADVVVTSCPLCHFNLDTRQKNLKEIYDDFTPLPVMYFTQLMELAMLGRTREWRKQYTPIEDIVCKVTI